MPPRGPDAAPAAPGTGTGVGSTADRLRTAWRRSGADLPWGDPRPTHRSEMEGWFWRFTEPRSGVVAIALCGINRSPEGDWATVAVAAHPSGVVRSAVVPAASASEHRFLVSAGDVLRADEHHLCVRLDDVELDATVGGERWPHALPGGGLAGVVPWLGQYWHPHLLRAPAGGALRIGGTSWSLDGATAYAEKNWGRGFPDRWWWGQANGFHRPDVAVAFGGGALPVGPLRPEVTGIVCAVGRHVLRLAPPLARVSADVDGDRWSVHGRTIRSEVIIEGDGSGSTPAILPVPLPAERRNVDTDLEHLAATIHLTVRRDGRELVRDTSHLAGLEVGSLPSAGSAPPEASAHRHPVPG